MASKEVWTIVDERAYETELAEIERLHSPHIVISIEEAARLKGVSKSAIYRSIEKGELDKVSGVTVDSLRRYCVQRHRQVNGSKGHKKKQNG